MSTTWHVHPRDLAAYASGETGFAAAASVESHLMTCGQCRARLQPAVAPARLDAVWAEVVDTIDAPAPGLVERLLAGLGISGATARLLAATPSLRLSWLGGVAAALAFALVAASASPDGAVVPLALAPLLPLLGVAAAYSPMLNPMSELEAATPAAGPRLLLLRAAAVLIATVLLVAVASALLPGGPGVAAAWLLPSLGLTGLTLLAGSRVDPLVAGGALAALWVGAVLAAYRSTGDPLAAAGAAVQLTSAAVALVCLVAGVARRDVLLLRSSL